METIQKRAPLTYLFIITGIISFFFSFLITVDKFELAADPNFVPPCSINPFISCGPVMASPQASAFGFPNPLLGIAGFAIITAIGFALLSGARFKRWFWIGTQIGVTFAIGFIYWLFSQAVFEIGALCPYCMVVWVMTIPLFYFTTVYNLREGNLGFTLNLKKWYHAIILTLMYGVIIAAITNKFWLYWAIVF